MLFLFKLYGSEELKLLIDFITFSQYNINVNTSETLSNKIS